MRRSYKINIPLRRAIRELKMIYHKCIPNIGKAKQLQKRYLKGLLPTPHIPIQLIDSIKAPPTPLANIFTAHYQSPHSLPHKHNVINTFPVELD